jgi:hypothetical protein
MAQCCSFPSLKPRRNHFAKVLKIRTSSLSVNSQLLLFQTCAHRLAWAAAQVIVEDDEDEEIWFDAVDSNVEISIEVKMNISDGHLYLKDDDLGQVLAVVEDAVEVRSNQIK